MNGRIHTFQAIDNFRDYGDYATAAGRQLTSGRLFRSANHARATDEDLLQMRALRVAVIVDLRHPRERIQQPSRRHPLWGGKVIESNVLGQDEAEAPHMTFLKTTDLSEDSVNTFMVGTYERLPFEERHIDLFTRYFQALADADGAVLIHCAAGKDRTGLLAALTHRAAGVSEDDLLEDYLLTNTAVDLTARAPEIAQRIEETYGRKATPAAVEAFLGVRPEFLKASFDVIEREYGSTDAYLEKVLGLDAKARDRVAARLHGED